MHRILSEPNQPRVSLVDMASRYLPTADICSPPTDTSWTPTAAGTVASMGMDFRFTLSLRLEMAYTKVPLHSC